MFHPSNQTYRGGSYTDVNSLVTNNSLYNTVTTINSSQYPVITDNLEQIKTINTTYAEALSSLAVQISSAMKAFSTQYFSSIHTQSLYEAQLIQYNAAQSTLSTYVGGYNYSTLYYSSMVNNLSTTITTVNLNLAALEQNYLSVMSAMLAPTVVYQTVYTEGIGYTQVPNGFEDKSEYANIFNSNGIISALMSIMILENERHKSTYDGLNALSTAKIIINEMNMSTYKMYTSTFIPSTAAKYRELSTIYVNTLRESNAEDDTISLLNYRYHSTLSTLSSLVASKKIEVEYLQANYPNYITAVTTLAGDDNTIKYISAAKLEGAAYSLYNSTATLMQEIEAIYSLTLQGLPIPSELTVAVGVQSGGASWAPTGIVVPLVCHPLSTVCLANKSFLTKYINAYNSLSIALPRYSANFTNAKAARIIAEQNRTAQVNTLLQELLGSYDLQLTGALQNITNYQIQIAGVQKELVAIQALYSSPTITVSTNLFTAEQLAYLTNRVQSGGSEIMTENNKMNAIITNHHTNVITIPRKDFLPSQISSIYVSELSTYTKEITEFPIKYTTLYQALMDKTASLQLAINRANQTVTKNTNILTKKTTLATEIAAKTQKISSLKLQRVELQSAYNSFNSSIVNYTGDIAGLISQRTIELQNFQSESAKYNNIFTSELSSEMDFYINTVATLSTSILIDYSSKILNTLNAPINKPYTISTSIISTMIICSQACMSYIRNLIAEKMYKQIYIDSKKAYDDESSRIISKGTRNYSDAEFEQLKNNYDTYISVVNNCIQYRINQNSVFISSISTLLPILEPATYSYFTETVQDMPDLGYKTNFVSTSIIAAATPVMNSGNALNMTVDSTTGITYYFNQSNKAIHSMGVTAPVATFDSSFVATNISIRADNGYIYVLEPSRNNLYKIYGGLITNMIGPSIWLSNPRGISNIVNNVLYVSCDLPSVKPLLWLDGSNTSNTATLLMDKSGNGYNATLNNVENTSVNGLNALFINNNLLTNTAFVIDPVNTLLSGVGTFVSSRIENKTIVPDTILYVGNFSSGYQISMDITGKAVMSWGPITLNQWNNANTSWNNNSQIYNSFFTLRFLSDPGIGKIQGGDISSPIPITGIRRSSNTSNLHIMYLCIDGPNYKFVLDSAGPKRGFTSSNSNTTNYINLVGPYTDKGENYYQLDFTKRYIVSSIPTPVTTTNTTVLIICNINSVPAGNNGKLLSFSNSSSSEIASVYTANGNLIASYNTSTSSPITVPQNTATLITTVYTPNAINIGINGATLTNKTPGTFSPLSIAQYSIGAVGTVTTNSMFTGTICEVLVYSQELSNDNRKAVEGYLANKWGVTLPYNSSGGSVLAINTVNSAVQTCIGSVNNTALAKPGPITQDSTGSYIYLADGNRIWKTVMTQPSTFVTTLFAGSQTNTAGYIDSFGTSANFNTINDMTVDSKNSLYALDSLNSVIRVVTPNGLVNTLSGIAPPNAYMRISSLVNVPVYTSTLVAPIIYSSTLTLQTQHRDVLKPGGVVRYRFGASSIMPSTIYTRSNIVAPNSSAWFNNMVNIMYSNNLLYYCNWNSISVIPCFTINTYTLLTIPMSYNLIEPRKNIFSVSYIPDTSPIPTCPPRAIMDSTPTPQPTTTLATTTVPSIVYGKLMRHIEIMKPNDVTQIGQIKVVDRTGKNVAFGAQVTLVNMGENIIQNFTPLIWLDAESPLTSSGKLVDRSGNGNHATLVNVSPTPMANGLNTLPLNGTNGYIEGTTSARNISTLTTFVVAINNRTNSVNNWARIVSFYDGISANDYANDTSLVALQFVDSPLMACYKNGSTSPQIPVPPLNTISILYSSYGNSLMSVGINGTISAANPANTTGIQIVKYFIGCSPAGPNAWESMTGSICEVLVFPYLMNDTQRREVEGYLATKWVIQSSLPATHPYNPAQYNMTNISNVTGVVSFPITTLQAPIQPNAIISQVQSGGQATTSDFIVPPLHRIKIDLGSDYDVTGIEYIKTNTSYSSSGLQIKTYNSISTISSIQTIGVDLAKTLFDMRSNLLTPDQKSTTPITVLASRKGACGILGRYIKISASAGSSAYSFSQITVITTDGTNIALGKRIGTTLNTTNSTVPITNLINGVYMSLPPSQSFAIVSNNADDYIIIDLGAEYDVAAVNIYYPKTN